MRTGTSGSVRTSPRSRHARARVARDLSSLGHRFVGVDLSPTLLGAAREADPASAYLLADAAELPFHDRAFDIVVAYNSLMDIEDMPGAVREVGRVLRVGGTFSICVTHPFRDIWRPVDESTFLIERPYLDACRFEEPFERDGLTMTFFGWTHPLQDYADALEAAGLHIIRIREPAPERPPASATPSPDLPMFLQLRAVKPLV